MGSLPNTQTSTPISSSNNVCVHGFNSSPFLAFLQVTSTLQLWDLNLFSKRPHLGILSLLVRIAGNLFSRDFGQDFGCGSDVVRMWIGCGSDIARMSLGRVFGCSRKVWQKLREEVPAVLTLTLRLVSANPDYQLTLRSQTIVKPPLCMLPVLRIPSSLLIISLFIFRLLSLPDSVRRWEATFGWPMQLRPLLERL